MKEEEKQMQFSFSFTDEFGQLNEYKSTSTISNLEVISQFDLVIEKFVQFLRSCGYSDELIKENIKL